MGTAAGIIESATWEVDPTGKSTAPTEHDVCEWMGSPDAISAAKKARLALSALHGDAEEEEGTWRWITVSPPHGEHSFDTPLWHATSAGTRKLYAIWTGIGDAGARLEPEHFLDIVGIHEVWKHAKKHTPKDEPGPPHPIEILVKGWLLQPKEAKPYIPKKTTKASVPNFDRGLRETDKTLALTRIAEEHAEPAQMTLPGVEPATKNYCQSWLLRWFDATGGAIAKKEKGAPRVQRLAIGALIHLDIADRNGVYRTITLPTEDVIRWIHPNGWANKRRDWDRFPEALRAIGQLPLVYIPGFGGIQVVTASVVPLHPDDPFVVFTVIVPNSAAHGARIDWELLCVYGAKDPTLYRAYLAVMAHLDRSASRGHPITRDIHPKILDKNGDPLRKKNGRTVRSKIELIPNELGKYVQTLNDRRLTALIGLDPENRKHRHNTRKAFERLDDDGVIDLQKAVGGYQIFGPRKGKVSVITT